jgi:vacuolar-type H+-ATPase subunit F/Vma7
MYVRVIGEARDVTGFALAGLDAAECHTRGEVIAALDSARRDPEVAIVVLSPAVAALAEDVVEEMRDIPGLPITIVLPPGGPS